MIYKEFIDGFSLINDSDTKIINTIGLNVGKYIVLH